LLLTVLPESLFGVSGLSIILMSFWISNRCLLALTTESINLASTSNALGFCDWSAITDSLAMASDAFSTTSLMFARAKVKSSLAESSLTF
jgi:hypothetical protein